MLWSILSILQSAIVFFIPYISYQFIFIDGKEMDLYATSMCTFYSIVILHYALICYFTFNWTWWILFNYTISFLQFVPLFIVIYNVVPNTALTHRNNEILFSSVHFWLICFVTVWASVLPFYFYYRFKDFGWPGLT